MSGENTVGSLNVEVSLELQKMQADFDKLNDRVAQQSKRIGQAFSKNNGLDKFFKGLASQATMLIPAASVASVVAFGKSLMDSAGAMVDAAGAARMGIEQFQVLSALAAESGVEFDQVQKSISALQAKIEDAADGNEAAVKSFEKLGLSWRTLRSLTPERQFETVAKAIVGAKDQNTAFGAALDLLGSKNAPRLLEALKQLGTEGFDALAKREKEAGQVLSEYTAKRLDEAGDKWEAFKRKVKNTAAESFVHIADTIDALDVRSPNYQEGKSLKDIWNSWETTGAKGQGTQLSADMREVNALAAEMTVNFDAITAAKNRALMESTSGSSGNHTRGFNAANMAAWKAAVSDQDKLNKLKEREAKLNADNYDYALKIMTPAARIVELEDKLAQLKRDTASGPNRKDAAAYDEYLKKQEEMLRLQELLNSSYDEFGDQETRRIEGLQKTKTAMQEFDMQVSAMWNDVSDRAGQAFADVILDGKNAFEELPRIVASSMIQIAARMAIINPLMNALFGLAMPSFFSLGSSAASGGTMGFNASSMPGRASGGPVSAGTSYVVGEDGREIFTPTTSGIIIPNDVTSSMLSGGGRGDTYVTRNQYVIQGDAVSKAELVQALDAHGRYLQSQQSDAISRGGNKARRYGG